MNTDNNNFDMIEFMKDMTLLDDIFMMMFFEDSPKCVEDVLNAVLPFKAAVETLKIQYECKIPKSRTVKLDIFAKDSENRTYNIEIQRRSDGAIPQRARYHSSVLDVKSLNPKQEFDEITDTYVIFITEHDVLKGNKPVYCIERVVLDPKQPLDQPSDHRFNDGSHIIYFNTAYTGDCDVEISNLIHDFRCTEPDDMINKNLSERFRELKLNPTKTEVDTMSKKYEERLQAERIEGRAEGRVEGRVEGHAEKAIEIAKAMLRSGKVTVEMIAEFCSLTVEEVNALKNPA